MRPWARWREATRFGALAAGTAVLVAVIAFVAWLAKAGMIVNFISESVMTGFKCGAALAVLIAGKVRLKNKPAALFVVIGGVVAAAALCLDARGVKVLGEVPQGLPAPGLPALHWTDLNQLLPLALACFLLSAVETAAVGRIPGTHGSPTVNGTRTTS